MKSDVLAELKKNYPKEWQLGFERGIVAYDKGSKLGYRRYKTFAQISFESLAYNDGFHDGYRHAESENVKLKTH